MSQKPSPLLNRQVESLLHSAVLGDAAVAERQALREVAHLLAAHDASIHSPIRAPLRAHLLRRADAPPLARCWQRFVSEWHSVERRSSLVAVGCVGLLLLLFLPMNLFYGAMHASNAVRAAHWRTLAAPDISLPRTTPAFVASFPANQAATRFSPARPGVTRQATAAPVPVPVPRSSLENQ
jgi:hypothetical protein